MPSRRNLLRALGGGALAASAGCVDGLTESLSRGSEFGASTDRPDHGRDSFADHVAAMDSTFGDHGVWGPADGGNVADLPFVGAWTDRTEAISGSGFGVVYDVALALYELSPPESDRRRCAGWLWCGARPVVADDGRHPRVTALETGVSLDGGEMGQYAPATDYGPDDSPVTVGPPAPDAPGPTAPLVIPAGRVRVVGDRTRVGEDGAFGVGWAGVQPDTLSVVGTFVVQWPADAALSFTVAAHVGASRGVL